MARTFLHWVNRRNLVFDRHGSVLGLSNQRQLDPPGSLDWWLSLFNLVLGGQAFRSVTGTSQLAL